MLEKGLTHTSRIIVANCDTAVALGSGDLPVLATPRMAILLENAAMVAVATELPDGSTTVGGHIDVSHLKPTPIGAVIEGTATLEKIDGRKLYFNVKAGHPPALHRRQGEVYGEVVIGAFSFPQKQKSGRFYLKRPDFGYYLTYRFGLILLHSLIAGTMFSVTSSSRILQRCS